jgi:hypothetical protein
MRLPRDTARTLAVFVVWRGKPLRQRYERLYGKWLPAMRELAHAAETLAALDSSNFQVELPD